MIPTRSRYMSSATGSSQGVDDQNPPSSLRAFAALKQGGQNPRTWKPTLPDGAIRSYPSSNSGTQIDGRDDIETGISRRLLLQQRLQHARDIPAMTKSTDAAATNLADRGDDRGDDRDDATRTTHASSISSQSGYSHIMDKIFADEPSPSNYNPPEETPTNHRRKLAPFDEESADVSTPTGHSLPSDEKDELDFAGEPTCRALLPSRSEIKEVMNIGVCRLECGENCPSDGAQLQQRTQLTSYSMETNSLAWTTSVETGDYFGLNSVNSSSTLPFDEPFDQQRELISVSPKASAVFVEQRRTVNRKGKDRQSYEVIPYSISGVDEPLSAHGESKQQACKGTFGMDKNIDAKQPGQAKISEAKSLSESQTLNQLPSIDERDAICTIPTIDLPSETEIYSSVDAVVRNTKLKSRSNNDHSYNRQGVVTRFSRAHDIKPALLDSAEQVGGKRVYSFYTPTHLSEDNVGDGYKDELMLDNRAKALASSRFCEEGKANPRKVGGEDTSPSASYTIRQIVSTSTLASKQTKDNDPQECAELGKTMVAMETLCDTYGTTVARDISLEGKNPKQDRQSKPSVSAPHDPDIGQIVVGSRSRDTQGSLDNPTDESEDPDIGRIFPRSRSGKRQETAKSRVVETVTERQAATQTKSNASRLPSRLVQNAKTARVIKTPSRRSHPDHDVQQYPTASSNVSQKLSSFLNNMRPTQSRDDMDPTSENIDDQHIGPAPVETSHHSCQSSPEAPVKEIVAPSDVSLISNLDHDESFRMSHRSSALHLPPEPSIHIHQKLSTASGQMSNPNDKQDIQVPVQTRWSFYDPSFVSNEDFQKESTSVQNERKVWSFYATENPYQKGAAIDSSYRDNSNNVISPHHSSPEQRLDGVQKREAAKETDSNDREDHPKRLHTAPNLKSKMKVINEVDKSEAPSLDEANSTGSKTSSIAPSLDEGNVASNRVDHPGMLEKRKSNSINPSPQIQTALKSSGTQERPGKNFHENVVGASSDSPLAKRLTPRRRNGEGRFAASVKPNILGSQKSVNEEWSAKHCKSQRASTNSKVVLPGGPDVTGAPSMDEGIDESMSSGQMPQRLVISKTDRTIVSKSNNFEIDEQSTSIRTGIESYKSDFTYSHLLTSSSEGANEEKQNKNTNSVNSELDKKMDRGDESETGFSSDFTYTHLMSFSSSESIPDDALIKPLSLDKLESVVEELTRSVPSSMEPETLGRGIKNNDSSQTTTLKDKLAKIASSKKEGSRLARSKALKGSDILRSTTKGRIKTPVSTPRQTDADEGHSAHSAHRSLRMAVDAAMKSKARSASSSKKIVLGNLQDKFNAKDGQRQGKQTSSLRIAVEDAMKLVNEAMKSDSYSEENDGIMSQDSSMYSECEFPKKSTDQAGKASPHGINDEASQSEGTKGPKSSSDENEESKTPLSPSGEDSSGESVTIHSRSDNSQNGTVPDHAIASVVNMIDKFTREQQRQNVCSGTPVAALANVTSPRLFVSSPNAEDTDIHSTKQEYLGKGEVDGFEGRKLQVTNSDDESCLLASKLDRYTSADECERSRGKYASLEKTDTDKYSVAYQTSTQVKKSQVISASGRYTPQLAPTSENISVDGSYLVQMSAAEESSSAPSALDPSVLSSTQQTKESRSATIGSGSQQSNRSKTNTLTSVVSKMMSVTRSLGYYRPPSYEGFGSIPSRLTSEQSTDLSSSSSGSSSSDDDASYSSRSSSSVSSIGSRPREIVTRPQAPGPPQGRWQGSKSKSNPYDKADLDFIKMSRSEYSNSSTILDEDPTIFSGESRDKKNAGSAICAANEIHHPTNIGSTSSSNHCQQEDNEPILIDRYANVIDHRQRNKHKKWISSAVQCGARGGAALNSVIDKTRKNYGGGLRESGGKSSSAAILADMLFCNPKACLSNGGDGSSRLPANFGLLVDDDTMTYIPPDENNENTHHTNRYIQGPSDTVSYLEYEEDTSTIVPMETVEEAPPEPLLPKNTNANTNSKQQHQQYRTFLA